MDILENQSHIVTALRRAIAEHRLHGSYTFWGDTFQGLAIAGWFGERLAEAGLSVGAVYVVTELDQLRPETVGRSMLFTLRPIV